MRMTEIIESRESENELEEVAECVVCHQVKYCLRPLKKGGKPYCMKCACANIGIPYVRSPYDDRRGDPPKDWCR